MQLAVDSIDIVSGARTMDASKIDFLALSIKASGLINPLIVVENAEVPNRYSLVCGRSRLTAVKKLGWQFIEGNVRTLSEVDRELIELGENLARSDYTSIEHAVAMKRYVALYSAAHPEVEAFLASTRTKGLKKGTKAEVATATAEAESGAALAVAPTPVQAVAAKFGVAPRTVQRAVKRADAFTDEEKVVLADRKLSERRLDELVAIPDRSEMSQVINLLAAGMDFPAAMTEVLGDRYDEDAEGEVEPQSDEMFLASCPAREKSNRARFDADALFYRAIQKQKIAFGRNIGWGGIKAKVGAMGIYARRLLLFFDCKHPRDWLTCPHCRMGVNVNQGGECKTCRGGGYILG